MSTASSFHPVDLDQWQVDARDAGAVEVWGAVYESLELYCKANQPFTGKNTAVQDRGGALSNKPEDFLNKKAYFRNTITFRGHRGNQNK